jgi:hypothetical protein
MENLMVEQTMYANVLDGKLNMTLQQLMELIICSPHFEDIDAVVCFDSKGREYTGRDLLEMVGYRDLVA